MNGLILDVGCGTNPKGDVNIDLYLDARHRREVLSQETVKRIPNFMLASAEHLPFRNDSFWAVVCVHVLEHLLNPNIALSEFRRVAPAAVILVPNSPKVIEREEHLYSWSMSSLKSLLSRYYDHVEVWAKTWRKSIAS